MAEDFQECPVCLEHCLNPQLLPCLHILCGDCANDVKSTEESVVPCPICLELFEVTEMMDVVPQSAPLTICVTHSESTGLLCLQCDEILCVHCNNKRHSAHSQMSVPTEAAASYLGRWRISGAKAREDVKILDQVLQQLETVHAEVIARAFSIRELVNEHVNEDEEEASALITQAQSFLRTQLKELDDQRDHLEHHHKRLQQGIDGVERWLRSDVSSWAILRVRKQVDQFINSHLSIPLPAQLLEIIVVDNVRFKLQNRSIRLHVADAKLSTWLAPSVPTYVPSGTISFHMALSNSHGPLEWTEEDKKMAAKLLKLSVSATGDTLINLKYSIEVIDTPPTVLVHAIAPLVPGVWELTCFINQNIVPGTAQVIVTIADYSGKLTVNNVFTSAAPYNFSTPMAVAAANVNQTGAFAVVDDDCQRVLIVSASTGQLIAPAVGGSVHAKGDLRKGRPKLGLLLQSANAVVISADGKIIWVVDKAKERMLGLNITTGEVRYETDGTDVVALAVSHRTDELFVLRRDYSGNSTICIQKETMYRRTYSSRDFFHRPSYLSNIAVTHTRTLGDVIALVDMASNVAIFGLHPQIEIGTVSTFSPQAVAFTNDPYPLLILSHDTQLISLFTLKGEQVRTVKLGELRKPVLSHPAHREPTPHRNSLAQSVAVLPNNSIIVTDPPMDRVVIFSFPQIVS